MIYCQEVKRGLLTLMVMTQIIHGGWTNILPIGITPLLDLHLGCLQYQQILLFSRIVYLHTLTLKRGSIIDPIWLLIFHEMHITK